jgi:AraC-like DNA-binding protein/quercetin dioxygenase-like cupin family protein
MSSSYIVTEFKNLGAKDNFPLNIMDVEHHDKVWLHTHDFYELVYIDKGFSMHVCDDTSTVLTSGDIFILRPGQVHAYISACHTGLYNCLFKIEIFDGVINDLMKLPGLDKIFSPDIPPRWEKLCLDLTERREVVLYLEKLKWERLNRAVGWELKIKNLLTELMILYSRLYLQRNTVNDDNSHLQYVYKALSYIDNHCGEDFFIKDIADFVGITPDYLAKHFKTAIGISPMEYVKNFRIAKAMEQLKLSKKSVAEVAREVGFSDISHFSRQFKQVAGLSPTEFRKNENDNL